MGRFILCCIYLLCCCTLASARHEGRPDTTQMHHDTMPMQHDHHKAMREERVYMMPHQFSRNLPMKRNGSGTSWHPDNSPRYMLMWMPGKWNVMLHYSLFLRYAQVNFNHPGKRGRADQFTTPNWVMGMANRKVGKRGLFSIRAMLSADVLTMGGNGYPLLLQTGESWQDRPLTDRQHPHDFVSELSLGYSHAFSKDVDLFGYFGFPGEPAIGPPTFMHRPSALNNPNAPLGHHWQDATHITFGVGTLGFRYKSLKLEGSIFTGKEPGENRYNFDTPRFDSYSARLSWNPDSSLAFSVAYGFLRGPESLRPEEDIRRITASTLHNYWLDDERVISTSFVWGMNMESQHNSSDIHLENSFLLESSLQALRWNYFTRLEAVEKSNEELNLPAASGEHRRNIVSVISLGASRYLWRSKFMWMDLGLLGTYHFIPQHLEAYYGSNPLSAEVFLRIVPPRMGR